jgi:hypothetical protein
MGDPPKSPEGAKPGWVATFAARLCAIAWAAAVLTELLPPRQFESLCILIGSQASALGIAACLIAWVRYPQGVIFLLLIATSAPGAYFVIVLCQIARLNGWHL